MGVRLGTATGDEWFSRPLRLSATGIVVPPTDGPWWLMAHQKFPVSRPADASAAFTVMTFPPSRRCASIWMRWEDCSTAISRTILPATNRSNPASN